MKTFFQILILCILTSALVKAGVPEKQVAPFQRLQLKMDRQLLKPTALQTPEWIIGRSDPNQIVEISEPFRYDGNIILVNNGRLIVRDTEFSLNGDMTIMGDARASFMNSTLSIIQTYAYEHQALVLENGRLELEHVNFRSSGHGWSLGLVGSAVYTLGNSEIVDGFITTAAFEHASIHVDRTKTAGEFLCFGDNETSFTSSDLVLFWHVLSDSADMEASLPEDSLLVDWQFPRDVARADGVPYRARIDSCTNVWWGLISRTGSTARFNDTHFRVIGLYFESPDSLAVENLSNGSHHADELIPASDRSLRLVNSTVDTWNFCASKGAKLRIDNCIFGETLSMDSSYVEIMNSLCDGSGGYIGVMNESLILVYGTLVRSEVISRQNGILIGVESAFLGSNIDAGEQSIMLLANIQRTASPKAHVGASVFEMNLPPINDHTNSDVIIHGTARVIVGPESPLEFRGYQVSYRSADDDWRSTDGKHQNPVLNGPLALWKTHGLEPGRYDLRLAVYHNFADSVETYSGAYLTPSTDVAQTAARLRTQLLQNSPNPFNPKTTIEYTLEKPGHVQLVVYNSMGQKVADLVDAWQPAGVYRRTLDAGHWPAGAYFYRLKADGVVEIKRMTLVK